ncbi:hypothetical protein [Achromobacter ruhlandii]|uniref:hypothetical protein n=1 Tax=Achromobacter ruhlandii TaxID=72557 RepID=UPI0022B8C9E4|nr:hypothetical protein [Achromobacter ruhlandii]MCZ8431360.1 hypothetical protein [Achromobacter ruhlandii]MDC6154142.1 hypothetical protein [Achromobacter ruhlandii]MDD7979762.1 hypothetical protein [Achromobacter ruhlandii]
MLHKVSVPNKKPPQLNEILNEFKSKINSNEQEALLKQINICNEKKLDIELFIDHNYITKSDKGKSNVYNTYLRIKGLCCYYHDKNSTNEAWYYFSKAEYFRGIHDSWDKVSEHKEIIENLKKEKEKQKSLNELSALDLIISKALQDKILNSTEEEKKYWNNKSDFVNESIFEVFEILNKYKKSKSKTRRITNESAKRMILKLIRMDSKLDELINSLFK